MEHLLNPELIKAAASSTLGLFSLMCVIIAALALVLFRNSPIWAKFTVFSLLLVGVAGFGYSAVKQENNPPVVYIYGTPAEDQQNAVNASKDILSTIQQKNFDRLWNTQTSKYFKSKSKKEDLISLLSFTATRLGSPLKSNLLNIAYSHIDQTFGYKGEIYTLSYLNTYSSGDFLENIVVYKEQDGKFRFSGYGVTTAPD